MPIEANYKTYYGIHLNHYSTSWGGNTYHKILVTEFPDSNLVSTDTTNTSSADFLYPRLITNKAYLDGVAEGHITIYNNGSSATTVTNFTVSLKKTDDVPSNETVLGSYTANISSDNSIPSSGYLTLPFFMPIDKQTLDENEKLIFHVEYTSNSNDLCIAHANDSNNVDIKIKVPYAPTG